MYDIFYNHQYKRDDISTAITLNSGKKGAHIVFTGAVHGSEPSGVEASLQIIEAIELGKIELTTGSVTWILANVEGFKEKKRYIHHNMNRVFTKEDLENTADSVEKIRAKELAQWINNNEIDLWVDLHSTSSSDEPMLVSLKEHNRVELASTMINFSTYFIISKHTLAGSLMQYCEEQNIPCFTLECGLHTSPLATDRARENMLSILYHQGVINKKPELKLAEKIDVYTAAHSLDGTIDFAWDIEKNRITTGEKIDKNELLAHDSNCKYKYNEELYLMMPDANPTVGDKGIAFLCSKYTI